ncbi:phosphate-starvation-inducible protein PsiE [Cedecea neteri]|uniref:Protein PsiE n=1 Tax=Cedecea neteri TaxID=158822 RepID=A0A2X2SYT1_9ENTR|nr:phosphate-starvation-inducible protein PsiE [Cedecea neteri]
MWFGMFSSLKIKWTDVFTALIRGMLNISLCFVGLILTIFLLREGSYMAAMLYNNTSEKSSYDLIEALVTYFLFFEFVALIVVYFKSGCHFSIKVFYLYSHHGNNTVIDCGSFQRSGHHPVLCVNFHFVYHFTVH